MTRSEPVSLLASLADVPDPRDRAGRRHPLAAMLAHACCAILCGCRGYAAIAQWGRDQPIELMHQLGYRRRPPAYGTFQGLFSRLDAAAFEGAVSRWVAHLLPAPDFQGLRPVAIDGKSSRGSGMAGSPAVHLLSALDQRTGAVLAQARVPAATNEHKAALALLKSMVLHDHRRRRLLPARPLRAGRLRRRALPDQGRSEPADAPGGHRVGLRAGLFPPTAGGRPPAHSTRRRRWTSTAAGSSGGP